MQPQSKHVDAGHGLWRPDVIERRLALAEAAKVNKNKTAVTENSVNALAKARANAISTALINAGTGSDQVTILDSADSATRDGRVITELGLQYDQ